MIIWINGAFSAGKTTLCEELRRRMPDAMEFDPEYVGFILIRWVPPAESGDFQDIPLWRKLVAEFAIGMAAEYERTLIVPMTLVNPQYQEEIFDPIAKAGHDLLHVFLDVPAEELHRRLDARVFTHEDPERDAQARDFGHRAVGRCVAASDNLPPGTLKLSGHTSSPAELADQVIAAARTR